MKSSPSVTISAWLCLSLTAPLWATSARAPKTPRQAAQEGIEWLQIAAGTWQKDHQCYGCHTQAQVIMGLSIAKRNHYVVNDRSLKALVQFIDGRQNPDGSFHDSGRATATQFASMALAYYDELSGVKSPVLLKSAKYLLTQQQPNGEIPCDHSEAPIDQGAFMTTANSAIAFMQAYRETTDPRFKHAAERGLNWIAANKPESTQDKVFVILGLAQYGTPSQKSVVGRMARQLLAEQTKIGGWKEARDSQGPNALATGQVLYAFKQAGVSVDSPEFQRGVHYLMTTQTKGFWASVNSQSGRPSGFAPTMWAVIGLAGSFHEPAAPEVTEEEGGLRVTVNSAVLFDFDRSDLKPEAEDALSDIKRFVLDQHPGSRIAIEGHTDDVGGEDYNLELSRRRAQAVAEWCTAHGIDPSLVDVNGYGLSRPKYPNTSAENRARNRRVEMVVTR